MSKGSSSKSTSSDFGKDQQSGPLPESSRSSALSQSPLLVQRTSGTSHSVSQSLRASNSREADLGNGKVPWGPWRALLVGISAYFTAIFLSTLIAQALLPESISDLDATILIYSFSSLVLISFVWGFLKIRNYSWRSFMGKFQVKDLAYMPLYYGVYFVATYIVQLILGLLPSYDADQSQSFGLDNASGHTLLGVLVVLVILPPIAEEILFRGLIYRGMITRWNKILAAILTSALFGLAHGQWNVAADTFVLSLVLIHALEKTKSLYLPMAIHMLKNLIAYILVFVLLT